MWGYTTLVLASAHLALGFSCVCSPSECEPLAEDDCPPGVGTVWDPCGCCRVCARTENEPCGGPYGFYGTCGSGLECVVSDVMSEGVEGTCKRVPGTDVHCNSPENVSGCNVISGTCRCGSAPVCPGETSPYTFHDHNECSINLDVMKEHARQRDIEDLKNGLPISL
ncbi:insulin-like growth factor-binding protein 7 [Cimex lectularius]|uniref:IGFBP N-terminal domain-containing protein n=1 Tax=Cimex lectularius TaxID=79782 RepID=A0A8I6S1A1_CIMLE|nr:insulin-like growth factor-binding protein 7 [Cimex lectularius]